MLSFPTSAWCPVYLSICMMAVIQMMIILLLSKLNLLSSTSQTKSSGAAPNSKGGRVVKAVERDIIIVDNPATPLVRHTCFPSLDRGSQDFLHHIHRSRNPHLSLVYHVTRPPEMLFFPFHSFFTPLSLRFLPFVTLFFFETSTCCYDQTCQLYLNFRKFMLMS